FSASFHRQDFSPAVLYANYQFIYKVQSAREGNQLIESRWIQVDPDSPILVEGPAWTKWTAFQRQLHPERSGRASVRHTGQRSTPDGFRSPTSWSPGQVGVTVSSQSDVIVDVNS